MKFIDTFAYHKNNSEISFDDYVRTMRIKLGVQVENKEKIYLDTKYWIHFRDVILGRAKNETLVESYRLLDSLCDQGIVVCPISEDIFYEITKQQDTDTLTASLMLIDKLSQGISLLSQTERIQAEILHFFHRYKYVQNELYPLKNLVWTKICYTIGSHFPSIADFSSADERVIQKSFFDQLWGAKLSELCKMVGYEIVNNVPRMPDLSDLLNEDAEAEREKNENPNFKQIFVDEIYFLAKYIEPMLKESIEYMYIKETSNSLTEEERKASAEDHSLVNMLCNIFRLGKEDTNFPTLKVGAGLHAAVRLDKKRRFVGNDYYDFRHAQAALPYCDYFFTEKNLKHILTMNSLAYDKEYDCRISSKPQDVLDELNAIKANRQLKSNHGSV